MNVDDNGQKEGRDIAVRSLDGSIRVAQRYGCQWSLEKFNIIGNSLIFSVYSPHPIFLPKNPDPSLILSLKLACLILARFITYLILAW